MFHDFFKFEETLSKFISENEKKYGKPEIKYEEDCRELQETRFIQFMQSNPDIFGKNKETHSENKHAQIQRDLRFEFEIQGNLDEEKSDQK